MKKRILIVDDKENFLFLWKQYFGIEGDFGKKIEIFTSQTSEGMLAAVREFEGKFDLVISDINRPDLSGIDCMEIVHKNYPDIPFIFLTGYGSDDIRDAAFKTGAKMFFSKPVDVRQFKKCVLDFLFENKEGSNTENVK